MWTMRAFPPGLVGQAILANSPLDQSGRLQVVPLVRYILCTSHRQPVHDKAFTKVTTHTNRQLSIVSVGFDMTTEKKSDALTLQMIGKYNTREGQRRVAHEARDSCFRHTPCSRSEVVVIEGVVDRSAVRRCGSGICVIFIYPSLGAPPPYLCTTKDIPALSHTSTASYGDTRCSPTLGIHEVQRLSHVLPTFWDWLDRWNNLLGGGRFIVSYTEPFHRGLVLGKVPVRPSGDKSHKYRGIWA